MSTVSSQKRKYELKARAERQQETRRRIVEATVALHQEVGPARTTVAEVARRAGVQRLTVYNHFHEEGELLAACQRHFLNEHPLPDFAEALALDDPQARVQAVLRALYLSYGERKHMTSKVLNDRHAVPALDALLKRTMDAQQRRLAEQLAIGFGARGRSAQRLRAALAVALEFWTWHRLIGEGLDDTAAADLMADVVVASASTDRSSRR